MCMAKKWKEKLDEEFEYDTGYYVDCYADEPYGTHGFIFKDGSILDIGIGEDHRVIDIDDWCKYGMLTYTNVNGEMDIRINCMVEFEQLLVAIKMAELSNVHTLYCDVYNREDRLVGSCELRYGDINIEELYDEVMELYNRSR